MALYVWFAMVDLYRLDDLSDSHKFEPKWAVKGRGTTNHLYRAWCHWRIIPLTVALVWCVYDWRLEDRDAHQCDRCENGGDGCLQSRATCSYNTYRSAASKDLLPRATVCYGGNHLFWPFGRTLIERWHWPRCKPMGFGFSFR